MTTDCICGPFDINERNGHSASCNRYNRKLETEASKPPKVKKPVKKVSDKMAVALVEYMKKKRIFMEANPKCEVFPELKSVDVHHARRKHTIELLLDETWWIAVSREGHNWIHANEQEAIKRGFLYPSSENEQRTIFSHHRKE